MTRRLALLVLLLLSVSAFPGAVGAASRGAGARLDHSTGRTAGDIRGARERAQPRLFFVKRVVDGDTLRLGEGEKARLIGVDTPETRHPGKPIEYYGPEASRFTRLEIEKRRITMDYEKKTRDKYGRLLCYVFRDPDGFFLNAEIIRQGFGRAYTRFPFRYLQAFAALELEAKTSGRGLWAREAGANARHEPTTVRPGTLIKENITKAPSPTVAGSFPPLTAVDEGEGDTRGLTNARIINAQEYRGSAKSNKFHYPGCMWARKIDARNMVRFKCREEAVKAGYVPCKVCNP